eukprot:522455_1
MALTQNKKPFVLGGWKCNGTKDSVLKLLKGYSEIDTEGLDVIFCPSFIHLSIAQNYNIKTMRIGAQNCSATSYGAFTGEISVEQLSDFGVKFVMIGHSERRRYYNETDEIISNKIKRAIENGLTAVACLGETLKDRQSNNVDKICFNQLKYIFKNISNIEKNYNKLILLYEPIWAIGTGVVCDGNVAQETHKSIRNWIKNNISYNVSKNIRIIYGGSVKPNNIYNLIIQHDIDGVGVGGASLNLQSFHNIIKTVKRVYEIPQSKL